jgi:hypothetical protein
LNAAPSAIPIGGAFKHNARIKTKGDTMKTKYFPRIVFVLLPLLAVALTPSVWAQYYVAGDFNGWNPAGNAMTEAVSGSGLWRVSLSLSAGRHEFKVTKGDWSWNVPGSGNSWLYADATGGVTITYDANTYSDGWSGSTERIGVDVDPGTWTAVGDWQGWNNANPVTAMTAVGGGIYAFQYFAPLPGTYQYKAVSTASWDAIGADARSVNAIPLPFTTTDPGQAVVFLVNATNGTIKVDVQQPLPCIATNSVIKFYQPPQLFDGLDVRDSRNNIVLADDFRCTSAGPITDIHIWGSWWNDVVGNITNFTIGIYGDVLATTNLQTGQITNSHPGALLWWTNFPQGGFMTQGLYTNNAYEHFYNSVNNQIVGNDTKVFYYCFFPTNPFVQQGSANAPTNYWLAIRAQMPADNTTNGWKSAETAYNDAAVWVTTGGGLPAAGAPWKSMTNPMTGLPIHLSMLLTTTTNAIVQIPCIESNGVKYVQWPNLFGGVDVWDSSTMPPQATSGPWWLADDFVCTNSGSISDIHLWGSWQNDAALLNSITFQLYVLDDVPEYVDLPWSHPGTNIIWHQTFAPGNYSENIWTNNAYEYFLDPGTPQILGNDFVVWYYCFYPTNLVQYGDLAMPKTYWLVAFAEMPSYATNVFGWKSTTNVQHDKSVHMPWTGFGTPPLNSLSWMPTYEYQYNEQALDLAFKLTTPTNQVPQTNCCPETNTIKWVQPPNLNNGVDIDASFIPVDPCAPAGWVLADDFLCTNSGAVKDIHIWGSWYNDAIDPNATFTLSIWSDVPALPTGGFSHPGNLLWSQFYGPSQFGMCQAADVMEPFEDGKGYGTPFCTQFYPTTAKLYHLCFPVPLPTYPSNVFNQTGTVGTPTNYWLSVTVQGTNWFGWKTSASNYNDSAVGVDNGSFIPAPSDWFIINDTNGLQVNMAFMIGTATNACTTPPQLQCSDLIVSCANLSWLPPVPVVKDPCCPNAGAPSMSGPFVISNCPTVYQYFWSYTNCQGLTAYCSSYVTVTSPPPALLIANYKVACGSPIPTNPPGVIDPCCTNIVPVWQYSFTNTFGCTNIISQVWQAVDCYCTNLSTTVTQTVTVVPSVPVLLCSNLVINCDLPIPTNPPAYLDSCCSNVTVILLSSTTNTACVGSDKVVTRLWWAVNCCSNSTTCTQTVTVVCPIKYTQPPDIFGGYDVWNSTTNFVRSTGPWVLADDFVCTNTGYITDVHIWGSWYYDFVATGKITFWLGLFASVPVSSTNLSSHPGNIIWAQCFPPGTYCESLWGPAQEGFLDPGPRVEIGPDTQVWYYSFFLTNPPVQWGSVTNPTTYWVGAFAQLPPNYGNSNYLFGWKTTTNIQHDVSVHSRWVFDSCPTNANPLAFIWVPTTNANTRPLDLAFQISTSTNCSPFVNIERLSTNTVRVLWPSGGVLQWTTNLLVPFADVPSYPSSPFIDTDSPPPPWNKFYRVRCD